MANGGQLEGLLSIITVLQLDQFCREQGRWDQSHFVRCVLEGLRQVGAKTFSSVQFSSVAQSRLTLCDPMNSSTPGLPAHHQLPEFTQTHVHQVGDAIQPSHLLLSPSPLAHWGQHQGLFQ